VYDFIFKKKLYITSLENMVGNLKIWHPAITCCSHRLILGISSSLQLILQIRPLYMCC